MAFFISEHEKVSWSDLEKRFVKAIPTKNAELPEKTKFKVNYCPECSGQRFECTEEGEIFCKDCGFNFASASMIARQTLLNYINALIKRGVVEKLIDSKTLRPIYRLHPDYRKQLANTKLRRELHAIIDSAPPSKLAEIRNAFDTVK